MATGHALVPRQTAITRAQTIVPYLTPEEVQRLCQAARENRQGERDALLIQVLFETSLRISEAPGLTLSHLESFEGRPVIRILGKGNKPRLVACPRALAESLQAYAWRHELKAADRLFPIKRARGFQIIQAAGEKARLNKKVYPHLLRHSDAIERLRQTGNPRALQLHLGHASPFMTMRYLSTLTAEDAVRIQHEVEFPR